VPEQDPVALVEGSPPGPEVQRIVSDGAYHGNRWATVALRHHGRTLVQKSFSPAEGQQRATEIERALGHDGLAPLRSAVLELPPA